LIYTGPFRLRLRDLGLLPRIQRARASFPESKIIDETSRILLQQYYDALNEEDPRLADPADEALLLATHISRRSLLLQVAALREPRLRQGAVAEPKSRANTAPTQPKIRETGQCESTPQRAMAGRRRGQSQQETLPSPTHGRRAKRRAATAAATSGGGSHIADDDEIFEDGI
jgi:hypothetical protein